jgi:hypothetical protein
MSFSLCHGFFVAAHNIYGLVEREIAVVLLNANKILLK